MLFVVIPFGKHPELVASIVKPFVVQGRNIFSRVCRIYEQKRMVIKNHLHETSTILRYKNQLHPRIGNLLRLPAFVIYGLNFAAGSRWLLRMGVEQESSQQRKDQERSKKPMCHRIIHLHNLSIAVLGVFAAIRDICSRSG